MGLARAVKPALMIALSLGGLAAAQPADQTIVVVRPANPPPVEGKDGAKIHILGGGSIDTGATGRVFGEQVLGDIPGRADVTVSPEQVASATRELTIAALKGCRIDDFDARAVMRSLEKGPWPPFVNYRASENTHQNVVTAQGESSIEVKPRGAERGRRTVRISLSSYIGSPEGVRTRFADCSILVQPVADLSAAELVEPIFGSRRIERKTFDGGEVWTLAPPPGVTWPSGRSAGVSFRIGPPHLLFITQSIREPVEPAAAQ